MFLTAKKARPFGMATLGNRVYIVTLFRLNILYSVCSVSLSLSLVCVMYPLVVAY